MGGALDRLYESVLGKHCVAYPGENDVRIARAPGRVNVIGEHTDYNGLPVLPTAIDREIAIAFSVADSQQVTMANVDARFGDRSFALSEDIEPFAKGDWGNYAKAASQAIWNWAAEHSPESLPLRGFRAAVGGTIPSGSGLSSSSAMVVASAFALIGANGLEIEPAELAGLLARAERYVGTEGGGMDQAASIMSRPGCVLKIDFNPLRTRAVPIAGDLAFVIANSMVVADKAGSARLAYNTRVVECRLGVQMLKSIARRDFPAVEDAVLLGDVMAAVPVWRSLIDELPDGGVSVEAVARFTGIDEAALRKNCLTLRDDSLLDEPAGLFQVKSRVRHVLTEAERVDLAAAAMSEGRLDDLGAYMDESHESCALDYEVSCKELDSLVRIMREHGALGARLTGAGFGGCAVAAVRMDRAHELLNGVREDYYQGLRNVDVESAAFECVASGGAGIRA